MRNKRLLFYAVRQLFFGFSYSYGVLVADGSMLCSGSGVISGLIVALGSGVRSGSNVNPGVDSGE